MNLFLSRSKIREITKIQEILQIQPSDSQRYMGFLKIMELQGTIKILVTTNEI